MTIKPAVITGILIVLVSTACQGRQSFTDAELAPNPSPGVNIPTTASLPPSPVTTAETREDLSTSTPSTSPLASTTEAVVAEDHPPILCAWQPHPGHHSPCPVATPAALAAASPSANLREQTTGWSIPTYIVMCESGGDWSAENASGAAGPYQLMPLHFNGSSALNQSQSAQHAKAAELWAGGRGASHWAACL